jgi:GNAT superfamily N-acetyltransferase
MDIDAGFLSRLLARLERNGLVARERSDHDARRQHVRLTDEGRAAFAELDRRSADEIASVLDALSEDDQRRLVASMDAVRDVLTHAPPTAGFVLRNPRPGDLGWIVQRHGALYAQQYGWDESFEALVAQIVAEYARDHDPRREAAWIAEVDGEPAGCVLCVRREEDVAQLRLLLVDPRARGRGIGGRLIEECLRFAQRAGYARITLWTNDVLHEARRLYERAGFELVESAPHHSFGHDLVEQTWARPL